MFPDYGLFFQQGGILFHFRFIKKILLSRDVIGSFSLEEPKSFLVR